MGQDSATVRITTGALAGTQADGVLSFKGIPFAAPPVGPLRWRPPAPPAAWSDVRAADRVGALSLQIHNAVDPGTGPLPMSEDCLTLNVWSPVDHGGPLPVMVWIHGGGLLSGSGTADLYDGSALARQGVVVVTLNYRLGRLGFFAHPELSRAHADEPLANYGLLDQLAALEWVRAHIEAFGGDPGNVTLFGESSGGVSVQRLMLVDAARGLFHKAIVQSGAGLERCARLSEPNVDGLPSAESQGVEFAASLGLSDPHLPALRDLPAERFIEGTAPSAANGFGPVIDGRWLTHDVGEAFAAGLQAPVPLLVGSNALELPVADRHFEGMLGFVTRGASEQQKARIKSAYSSGDAFRQHVVSDVLFTAAARRQAQLHARAGHPTYLYRFSVLSASIGRVLSGAPHASERQYVFRTLSTSSWPTDANDETRAAEMSAYWVAFAKTGSPNTAGLPEWPRYADTADLLLDLTNEGPRATPVPDPEALDAITELKA